MSMVINIGGGGANAYTPRLSLATNLTTMGVTASASESLDDLIAKVLSVPVPGADSCTFTATLSDELTYSSYAYLEVGETFCVGDEVSLTAVSNMASAFLYFSGDGAENLVLSGDTASLWTESERSEGILVITYAPEEQMSKFDLRDALAGLLLSSTASVDLTMMMGCTGTDDEDYYAVSASDETATGSMTINGIITWGALEAGYTWGDAERLTWPEIYALPKPESA